MQNTNFNLNKGSATGSTGEIGKRLAATVTQRPLRRLMRNHGGTAPSTQTK